MDGEKQKGIEIVFPSPETVNKIMDRFEQMLVELFAGLANVFTPDLISEIISDREAALEFMKRSGVTGRASGGGDQAAAVVTAGVETRTGGVATSGDQGAARKVGTGNDQGAAGASVVKPKEVKKGDSGAAAKQQAPVNVKAQPCAMSKELVVLSTRPLPPKPVERQPWRATPPRNRGHPPRNQSVPFRGPRFQPPHRVSTRGRPAPRYTKPQMVVAEGEDWSDNEEPNTDERTLHFLNTHKTIKYFQPK